MSALVAQIKEHQKDAMRAKDKARLGTLRLILSEVKQREVDTRTELSDDDLIVILTKMVKQRRDSVTQYTDANRLDLAEVEQAEIIIIEEFLPQPLSNDEVETLIEEAIAESGAAGMQDMGKVMAVLKPRIQGRADIGAASGKVRAKLNA
ncbi:GatB/YqeY domain-containing protein [Echinimonas agarilytica]|uniref:GatB/YqeY domain-containing protein n=1 Tax=Echinimonas agarilytica TaxID=1215918 RepID=A0AA42B8M3_9GAMM|nr:GatB/YqeY domain-containing protein [Echinimonas agarilytica]MCM2680366.1 GatB/YqeY domain-containing protein [Echinimonas agarilytica]